MTLPSSGSIKFSQINTEMGRASTNKLAIWDYGFRNLSGRYHTTSPIKMSDMRGKTYSAPMKSVTATRTYNIVNGTTQYSWSGLYSSSYYAVSSDSSGNLYLTFQIDERAQYPTTNPATKFVKFNSSFTYSLGFGVDGRTYAQPAGPAMFDASSNIYIPYYDYYSSVNRGVFCITKTDSAGNHIYTNMLDNSVAGSLGDVSSVVVGSSVYFVSSVYSNTDYKMHTYITSVNNAQPTWQKDILGLRAITRDGWFTTDGTYLYILGYVYDGSGFVTTKMNTSGSIVWQRHYGSTSPAGQAFASSVKVDSSGNVYCLAGTSDHSTMLVKYNSSGTLQWARNIYVSQYQYNGFYSDIVFDSSSNIYLISGTDIAKYNSSGVAQWRYTTTGSDKDNPGWWFTDPAYPEPLVHSYMSEYSRGGKCNTFANGYINIPNRLSINSNVQMINAGWVFDEILNDYVWSDGYLGYNNNNYLIAIHQYPTSGGERVIGERATLLNQPYTIDASTPVYYASSMSDQAASYTDVAGSFPAITVSVWNTLSANNSIQSLPSITTNVISYS